MGTQARQSNSDLSTPDSVGNMSTPQHFIGNDHSFTLQAIMELQKSTGQLSECVNSLRASMEKHGAKIDKLEDKLSDVTHKLYAAGVVLMIALAIGGFIVNKSWDIMAQQIAFKNESQVKVVPQPTTPAQTPKPP